MTAPDGDLQTIGSLFTGYGGLDMAVQTVIPSRVVWQSDVKPAAVTLLDYRHPDVPNLGDVTQVDWTHVERPDIIVGGFPCQDISAAGLRAGLVRKGPGRTSSGLWAQMAAAVEVLRPALVVVENVRAVTSAAADGYVEPCPWCLGELTYRPLRALGAVLGDLADLGYDATWTGLPASGLGACHERYRVFVIARPTAGDTDQGHPDRWPATGFQGQARPPARPAPDTGHDPRQADDQDVGAAPRHRDLAAHTDEAGRDQRDGQSGSSGWTEPAHGGHGTADPAVWGVYTSAVQRWERVLGRPAPDPVEPSPRGGAGGWQLNARAVEWMMGLPDGWVTGVPGLARTGQLSLLGDGVVPQQGAAALSHLLAVDRAVA